MPKQLETTDLLYLAETIPALQNNPEVIACTNQITQAHEKLATLIASQLGVDAGTISTSIDPRGEGSFLGYTSSMHPRTFFAPIPEPLKEHDIDITETSSDWAPARERVQEWLGKAKTIIEEHKVPDDFIEESLTDATVLFLQPDNSFKAGRVDEYNEEDSTYSIVPASGPTDDPVRIPQDIILAAMLLGNAETTQDFPFRLPS